MCYPGCSSYNQPLTRSSTAEPRKPFHILTGRSSESASSFSCEKVEIPDLVNMQLQTLQDVLWLLGIEPKALIP